MRSGYILNSSDIFRSISISLSNTQTSSLQTPPQIALKVKVSGVTP